MTVHRTLLAVALAALPAFACSSKPISLGGTGASQGSGGQTGSSQSSTVGSSTVGVSTSVTTAQSSSSGGCPGPMPDPPTAPPNHAEVLADTGAQPVAVAIDDDWAYWITDPQLLAVPGPFQPGTLSKCGKSGCSAGATTLATGLAEPFGIIVDATNIYWTNSGHESTGFTDGSVMTCPKTGCCTPTTLASNQNKPVSIAADDTNVYWMATDAIWVCAKTGCNGKPTSLHKMVAQTVDLVVADGQMYWFEPAPDPNGPLLVTCPVSGCLQGLLVHQSNAGMNGLHVQGPNAYFSSSTVPSSGGILSVPIAGGPTKVLAMGTVPIKLGALDQGWAFWANYDGSIQKVPLTGGVPPVTLATGQQQPQQMAADSTAVYWVDFTLGVLARAAR